MLLSPLVMGLVLMVDPWAKNVDFSGGAAFELRGGVAPIQPSQPSVPALWLSLVPRATMTYQDRVRGREVSLEYSPQAYLRLSEGIFDLTTVRRPLLFNQVTLRYAEDINRRWSWQGTAGASIGEQDYSLQSGGLVQGDGSDSQSDIQTTQPVLVDNPIIQTFGFSGGAAATVQLTPVHSLSFGPSVTVQRLLSEVDSAVPLTFDQTSVDMVLTHSWFASRVDTLGTSVLGGYADFGEANGTQAYASGTLRWRRRLRPRLDSDLSGGLFFTRQIEARADTDAAVSVESRAVPLLPTGGFALIGRVLERSRLRISTDINVGSQAYFDPVQGSVLPLVGGGAGVTVQLPPDLTVGATGTFYTPPTPLTEADAMLDPLGTRTTLGVRTPVSYTIDDHLAVEVGTIVNARGPHLSTEPWEFSQTEFWVYVSFSVDYTTQRSP